jgi:hypothetical protein
MTLVKGKFIAINTNLKICLSHIKNLMLYLKELEKGEQPKSKCSRGEEIIKTREEVNDVILLKCIICLFLHTYRHSGYFG